MSQRDKEPLVCDALDSITAYPSVAPSIFTRFLSKLNWLPEDELERIRAYDLQTAQRKEEREKEEREYEALSFIGKCERFPLKVNTLNAGEVKATLDDALRSVSICRT